MPDVLHQRAGAITVDTLQVPFGPSGFACSFAVEKRLDGTPNTCQLTIYNLNESHRGEISVKAAAVKKKRVSVQVEAGYEGNTSRIFLGDLRLAYHEVDGPEVRTCVEAGTGEWSTSRARIFKSWAPGTPVSTVLKDVAGALGLGAGNLAQATVQQFLGGGDAFVGGTACSGKAVKELTRITRSLGIEWSVQDGTLQFLSSGKALESTAVVVSAATGMIGSPNVDQKGILKIRTLLVPDIFPGRKIKLEGATLQGFYRVEKVRYSGDTWGQDWYADSECKRL